MDGEGKIEPTYLQISSAVLAKHFYQIELLFHSVDDKATAKSR